MTPSDLNQPLHFENLWEEAEKIFLDPNDNSEMIITELKNKLSVYQALIKTEINSDEKRKLRTHLFGKLIVCLTQLSALDDINSFAALFYAIREAKKNPF
jgi:hypothetical protein